MPLRIAIKNAGTRPPLTASRSEKKKYSESVSHAMALALADELRKRGLTGILPTDSPSGKRGGERRIAGGLGDKRVDVTFATAPGGLILAVSIKTISFPDEKTRNYQKNLQNRKGDMIFEVATLHKRFPYAVIGGIFFLYEDAARDHVGRMRISTFDRAHQVFKVFNHRVNHRNEESKFEFLVVGLYASSPARFQLFEAGDPRKRVSFERLIETLLKKVAERNPEDYLFQDGRMWKPTDLGIGS